MHSSVWILSWGDYKEDKKSRAQVSTGGLRSSPASPSRPSWAHRETCSSPTPDWGTKDTLCMTCWKTCNSQGKLKEPALPSVRAARSVWPAHIRSWIYSWVKSTSLGQSIYSETPRLTVVQRQRRWRKTTALMVGAHKELSSRAKQWRAAGGAQPPHGAARRRIIQVSQQHPQSGRS